MRNQFIAAAVLCCACACGRSGQQGDDFPHHDHQDTSFPVIQILRPTANQVFRNSDTIFVEGVARDNHLHGGNVQIINDSDSSVLKQQVYDMHGINQHPFFVTHRVATSLSTTYTVRVEYKDFAQNRSVRSVKVTVQP